MPGRRETLHLIAAAALAPLPLLARTRDAAAQAPQQVDPWPDLATQIFGGRPMQDGGAVVAIDAPVRAEDAAIVPVTLRTLLAAGDPRHVRGLTLVIDQNPSPLALQMTLGPRGPASLSTRVRVDSYTNMHVVAELSDGNLYMTRRYVKAAGGCSAPAATAESGAVKLGAMRLRQFPADPKQPDDVRSAMLMIRHPNYSGMQMDQLTRLYVPAHFIEEVRVAEDDNLLFAIKTGISISENPEFRFPLPPGPAHVFRAEARDNEGADFKGQWQAVNSAA